MSNKISVHFGDLSKIDLVYSRREDDCAVLGLVTVGYIDGSPEIQTELLDKMEGYLKHINSEDFKAEYPQSTIYIDVIFEEKPHVLITDLLYKCTSWCKENGANLRLKIGEEYYRFL